ncbi:MAG: small basic family protein [Candidatus Dormibacteria bacterium]
MWVVLVVVVFALAGAMLGQAVPFGIPVGYARYTAVMLLAAIDSITGAFKSWLSGRYESRIFFSGLVSNVILAGGLTLLGDKLGVDLSIAAIVAFGVRIFNNVGTIRRQLM